MAKSAKRPAPPAKTRKTPSSTGKAHKSAKGKYVYFFGQGKAEGDRTMRDVLGGKGAGLAEMTNAGLPVPPGFTISTGACTLYYQQRASLPDAVDREMLAHLKRLEQTAGAAFGSTDRPLLVSVRSGA